MRGDDRVRTSIPNLLMIDGGGRVVIAGGTDVWASAGIAVRVGEVVPTTLRSLIDGVLEAWPGRESALRYTRIIPWPEIAVSIYEVERADASLLAAGNGRTLVALTAERFGGRSSLRRAQRLYGLSPREIDILQHVLSGAGTTQIALALSIADSTVIAHIKSLLLKTRAANRAALVARVLGWEEP